MRLAIITPADMTAVTEICGVIMRQFYDTFMKKPTGGQEYKNRNVTAETGFLAGSIRICFSGNY
ncbi:hypothetical protein CUN67_04380 [Pantoea cypripedii]|jgi:hypothetical protein|uniref:Uncharacterized protein n=1 Tax=Pantoea cypripedii TaxID=55209 RepID=A0A6B9FX43_PANCY|nr:hypothetical protein CUN67_04380 [Pantoea cypripedii]